MGAAGGPRPENEGWYKVYEWSTFNDVSTFSYDIDNSSSAPSFSRIRYIMAMNNHHVSIEVDDFTSNTANRVGVPLSWTYEVDVDNMVVKYNKPGQFPDAVANTQYNRIDAVQGRINFWPSNYGTTGENDAKYDSDDSGYSTSNGHGSFQFFDVSVSPSHCMFAWNHWGYDPTDSFGMGNFNGTHPDWTFSYEGGQFNYRFARIFVK